jgi:hypothetical protein
MRASPMHEGLPVPAPRSLNYRTSLELSGVTERSLGGRKEETDLPERGREGGRKAAALAPICVGTWELPRC